MLNACDYGITISMRFYVYSHWNSKHFGEKMEGIGPILRNIELYAYRNLVFWRDLMRFHKSEVLHFIPLRLWAFWQKNWGNQTNIKEYRAICLSRFCIPARSCEKTRLREIVIPSLQAISILFEWSDLHHNFIERSLLRVDELIRFWQSSNQRWPKYGSHLEKP